MPANLDHSNLRGLEDIKVQGLREGKFVVCDLCKGEPTKPVPHAGGYQSGPDLTCPSCHGERVVRSFAERERLRKDAEDQAIVSRIR